MNKNNFFCMFAHIYIHNIKRIIKAGDEIWDSIVNEVLPGLWIVILDILTIILRVILCILPIKQIHEAYNTQYLTREELKQKTGLNYKDGYFWKKEVRELEAEYVEKTEYRKRQMSQVNIVNAEET